MAHIPKPAPFFTPLDTIFKRSGNTRLGMLRNMYTVDDPFTLSTYHTRAEAEEHYTNSILIDAQMAAEKDAWR